MKMTVGIFGALMMLSALSIAAEETPQWGVHDPNRPMAPVVAPGQTPQDAPSDAIVLFDGKNLSAWSSANGSDAKWKVADSYMEVTKTGDIQTRQAFGSCQLHIEWRTPDQVKGDSQGRGNSGIFLMSKYELQVLDTYDNKTYADGQAAAIYGQKPPLVNVCRKPGEWQTYDIIFHAPKFDGDKVVKPGTITVLQNGVLVQDHWEIKGTTFHKLEAKYEPHAEKMPLKLQDHGNPTRFRNIWIRPLD